MVATPRLIVFEGADAVGKNEMSTKLVDEINKMPGRRAKRFAFPRYETKLGKAILRHLKREISVREDHTIDSSFTEIDGLTTYKTAPEDALVFQCMMVADKYHAAQEISDTMDHGFDVVCDRWWQSAYAFGKSDGLDEDWLLDVHQRLPDGHINILLDLSAEESARRRPVLRDRYEQDRGKQEEIRRIYRELWDKMAKTSPPDSFEWVKIDAGQTRDEVFKEVMDAYCWQ